MARFCTSCGSPVAEDMVFCPACGASLAPPVPPAPEPVRERAVEAPTTPAAAGPPAAKPSSPLLKIILIVVLAIVFAMIASIGACVYIGYRAKRAVDEAIKTEESGKSVEIQTPGGVIKMGETTGKTPTEIGGVPVYPGAKALEAGAQFSFGDKFQIGGQEFVTDDSVDQVVAFYKERYGTELMMVEADDHHRLTISTGNKQERHVVTIDVSTDSETSKTKIVMSHLGGKETP